MSVQDEINRISNAKTDIANALEEKGVSVAEGTKLDEMGDMVRSIPSGGEENVIESVSVNSIPLPITNKGVNIDLSGYVNLNESTTISKENLSIGFETATIEAYTTLTMIGEAVEIKNFSENAFLWIGDDDIAMLYGKNGVDIQSESYVTLQNSVYGSKIEINGLGRIDIDSASSSVNITASDNVNLKGADVKAENTSSTAWLTIFEDGGVSLHSVDNDIYVMSESGAVDLSGVTAMLSNVNGTHYVKVTQNGVDIKGDTNVQGALTVNGNNVATEYFAETIANEYASDALVQADNYTDVKVAGIASGWQTISYTTSNIYTSGATSPTISLTNLTVKANPFLRLISVGGRVTVNTTSAWTTTPGFYFNTTPLKNVIGSMPSATFVAPITCTLNGTFETEMAYIQLTSSQFRVLQYESAANHRTAGKRIYYLNAMIPY